MKIKLQYIIIPCFLALIQISFFSRFVSSFCWIDYLLIGIMYCIFFHEFDESILFCVSGGCIADLFSVWPFGTETILHLIIAMVVYILSLTIFTNKSLYSFIVLGFGAIVMYIAIKLIFQYGLYIGTVIPSFYSWREAWNYIINFFIWNFFILFGFIFFRMYLTRWFENKFFIRHHAS